MNTTHSDDPGAHRAVAEAEAQLEFARLIVQGAICAYAPQDVQDRLLAANDRALSTYINAVREAGHNAAEALAAYEHDWDLAAQDITQHHGVGADWR